MAPVAPTSSARTINLAIVNPNSSDNIGCSFHRQRTQAAPGKRQIPARLQHTARLGGLPPSCCCPSTLEGSPYQSRGLHEWEPQGVITLLRH